MTTLIRARIIHDESPESPREWDNVGHLVTWDRFGITYEDSRGKQQTLRDVNGIGGRQLAHQHMRGESVAVRVALPSSMHRGGDRDGFLYATRADVLREWGTGADALDKARAYLESEARTYVQWCDGDVYGRVIERRTLCELCEAAEDVPDDCPHCEIDEDSCWGFYGTDDVDANGMTDGLSEAEAALLRAEADAYHIEYSGYGGRIAARWREAA